MPGSCECCPVGVPELQSTCGPEFCVRDSTLVWYTAKYTMLQGTFNRTFQALDRGKCYTCTKKKTLSEVVVSQEYGMLFKHVLLAILYCLPYCTACHTVLSIPLARVSSPLVAVPLCKIRPPISSWCESEPPLFHSVDSMEQVIDVPEHTLPILARTKRKLQKGSVPQFRWTKATKGAVMTHLG